MLGGLCAFCCADLGATVQGTICRVSGDVGLEVGDPETAGTPGEGSILEEEAGQMLG